MRCTIVAPRRIPLRLRVDAVILAPAQRLRVAAGLLRSRLRQSSLSPVSPVTRQRELTMSANAPAIAEPVLSTRLRTLEVSEIQYDVHRMTQCSFRGASAAQQQGTRQLQNSPCTRVNVDASHLRPPSTDALTE